MASALLAIPENAIGRSARQGTSFKVPSSRWMDDRTYTRIIQSPFPVWMFGNRVVGPNHGSIY